LVKTVYHIKVENTLKSLSEMARSFLNIPSIKLSKTINHPSTAIKGILQTKELKEARKEWEKIEKHRSTSSNSGSDKKK
jgi:hypothetical protein